MFSSDSILVWTKNSWNCIAGFSMATFSSWNTNATISGLADEFIPSQLPLGNLIQVFHPSQRNSFPKTKEDLTHQDLGLSKVRFTHWQLSIMDGTSTWRENHLYLRGRDFLGTKVVQSFMLGLLAAVVHTSPSQTAVTLKRVKLVAS